MNRSLALQHVCELLRDRDVWLIVVSLLVLPVGVSLLLVLPAWTS